LKVSLSSRQEGPDQEQNMTMSHNHRLRAELDQHELAALQRFMVALHEEPHGSNPRVDMTQVFRGLEGQIFVPVTVSGATPDAHLAMLMGHKAEQLYKQSGCRFVLLQRLEADLHRQSYVWAEGVWQTVP
jgi:hypothetical protein